jgi:hypothetical protein
MVTKWVWGLRKAYSAERKEKALNHPGVNRCCAHALATDAQAPASPTILG